MTALTCKVIDDYPFKVVESVQNGEIIFGLIEKQNDGRYKAFVGTGFSCKYLRLCNSKRAAVEAIERAAADSAEHHQATAQSQAMKIKVGDKFSTLTVVAEISKDFWECRCSCGQRLKIRGFDLRQNWPKYCGCKP